MIHPSDPRRTTASTARDAFRKALFAEDDAVDGIVLKPVSSWTEQEQEQIARHVLDLPSGDPRRDDLDGLRRKWFSHRYGEDPLAFDATGRMIEPRPRRWVPEHPESPRTRDGHPLEDGLERIGGLIEAHARDGSYGPPVKTLQAGLNVLNGALREKALMRGEDQSSPGPAMADPLAEDGEVGPKTRQALKRALADLGAARVEEAFALGRFRDLASSGETGTLGPGIEAAFGPLFRKPGTVLPDSQPREEAAALQATLNDAGRKAFGPRDWQPLAEDGRIGPRTRAAFARLAGSVGPDRLARRFAGNLGFL